MTEPLTTEMIESFRREQKKYGIAASVKVDDICDAALKGVEPKQDGWRDVESAPKMGVFLLGSPAYTRAIVGRWNAASEKWQEMGGGYIDPTHWQPLPVGPSKQEVAGASEGESSCDCCGRKVPSDQIERVGLPNNAGVEADACSECRGEPTPTDNAAGELSRLDALNCEPSGDGTNHGLKPPSTDRGDEPDYSRFELAAKSIRTPQQEAEPVGAIKVYNVDDGLMSKSEFDFPTPAKGDYEAMRAAREMTAKDLKWLGYLAPRFKEAVSAAPAKGEEEVEQRLRSKNPSVRWDACAEAADLIESLSGKLAYQERCTKHAVDHCDDLKAKVEKALHKLNAIPCGLHAVIAHRDDMAKAIIEARTALSQTEGA